MSEIRQKFENGKYEVVFNEKTGELYALRNGEPWRDLPGDKLVLAMLQEITRPIPMVLHCPYCRAQHIDEGEWATKPHRTHLCAECDCQWRPAKVSTVGVKKLSEVGATETRAVEGNRCGQCGGAFGNCPHTDGSGLHGS